MDLNSRKNIEFIYLLSSRCFFNMSFVLNDFVDSNNPIVISLKKTVNDLYQKVKDKLKTYSELLTKK